MEFKLETPDQEASRLGQKPVKEVDPINQPGTALLQAIKNPGSDPANVADLQKAADDKYAVRKPLESYVDEPNKKENLDSETAEAKRIKVQEQNEMAQHLKRSNEVKGGVASLDKKAKSFNKISKFGFGVSGLSVLAGLGTWVGAGSVAGGAALLPVLAPIAVPIISGAIVIGGVSFVAASILKLLKNRAQNKKYDLQNDNRAMFGNI